MRPRNRDGAARRTRPAPADNHASASTRSPAGGKAPCADGGAERTSGGIERAVDATTQTAQRVPRPPALTLNARETAQTAQITGTSGADRESDGVKCARSGVGRAVATEHCADNDADRAGDGAD
ncbi:hypothetical protein Aab01nite_10620 [Paractinoplanes abujensis]|nr:hypothetical protein Aab01nite_10620 [Actinoplanes abujensis]